MGTKRVVYRVRALSRADRRSTGLLWGLFVRLPAGEALLERTCATKAGAVAWGREEARGRYRVTGEPTQLVVHNLDGRIAFEATYGSDPRRRVG